MPLKLTKISLDKNGLEKRQKNSGPKFLGEGVHDVILKEVEKRTSEKTGTDYYLLSFYNGTKKATHLVFPPSADRKYDPSSRNNRLNEQLFATAFGLDMNPEDVETYSQNLSLGYSLLNVKELKGISSRLQLGYSGLHAKYCKDGDNHYFMLCKRNGEPMKGYEDKKFDTRGAVKAELETLNQARGEDKQFRFHEFVEVQEFLEPKESNTAKLAKYLKPDEQVESEDEAAF